jgi:molecular chaperone DnaJ
VAVAAAARSQARTCSPISRPGFKEAAFGAQREVEIGRMRVRRLSQGGARRDRTAAVPYLRWHRSGAGRAPGIFGTVMTAHPCGACRDGEEIVTPCERCDGRGRVPARTTVPIDVPAGVTDGMELRIGGGGHAGRAGGPPGDLYLSINVDEDPVFERHGPDVFAVLEIPMVQAALGGEVQVATLDDTERVGIDPGPSPDHRPPEGQGDPEPGRGRGDLFLTIAVQTPRDLSKDQRSLKEELARLRGEVAGKRTSTEGTLRRPGTQAR